jgi:hypothetical protein
MPRTPRIHPPGFRRTSAPAVTVLFAGLAGVACTGPAAAQIATDRPNVVESSLTVAPGIFQFEGGISLDRGADPDVWTTPILLRWGLVEEWELRLETPGLTRIGDPVDVNGRSDVAVGAKWSFLPADGEGVPSVAAIFHLDLPLGSSELGQDGVRPSVRATADWTLDENTGLGLLGGVRFDRQGTERFASGILAVALYRVLAEDLSGYGEFALSRIAGDEFGGDVALLNGGLLYLLDTDTQLDVQLGVGVSESAPDVALTVGFSRRFGVPTGSRS